MKEENIKKTILSYHQIRGYSDYRKRTGWFFFKGAFKEQKRVTRNLKYESKNEKFHKVVKDRVKE